MLFNNVFASHKFDNNKQSAQERNDKVTQARLILYSFPYSLRLFSNLFYILLQKQVSVTIRNNKDCRAVISSRNGVLRKCRCTYIVDANNVENKRFDRRQNIFTLIAAGMGNNSE